MFKDSQFFSSFSLDSVSQLSTVTLLLFIPAFIFIVRHVTRLVFADPRRLVYPPGPKGVPFLGNAHQMAPSRRWYQFADWASRYGSVVGIRIMRQTVIILNKYEVAVDLLTKKGAIYSSRPKQTLGSLYGGWDFATSQLPYGDELVSQRRFAYRFLNAPEVTGYHAFLAESARIAVARILRTPENFKQWVHMSTGRNIMMMAYGHEVSGEEDEWIKRADSAVQTRFVLGTPGAHPIDIFPILGKLPFWIWGKEFKKNIEAMRSSAYGISQAPYEAVRKQMREGTAVHSMVSKLVEDNIKDDGTVRYEKEIYGIAGTIYFAGTDTSNATIEAFIVAMITHPDIQKKAQSELDELLRGQRLPVLEDRDALPYVQAVFKETLRWKPVVPLGLPHFLTENDEYKGMLLPARSIVIGNTWNMMHDEEIYPLPLSFDPTRFLLYKKNKPVFNPDILDPEEIAFGFGRRICPGRHFAVSSIWITMATLLTAFEMSPPLDSDGKPVLPDLEFGDGLASRPKPFRCVFRPRSDNIPTLLSDYPPASMARPLVR
ncbi:cytochrome P450 [Sistotremastrum niveocremeum HHB9708]|uniref:Cytochrome P450 n=1 Tax=Sistotremastrum niveocremeum HHB9708 TaxID=1314777 RepID=A0A164WMC0_9AGAM|nr:cytochrome P450 [Sistotremastrum niveocremeum HHB9708]